MKRLLPLVLGVLACGSVLAGQRAITASEGTEVPKYSRRGEVVYQIVKKWGPHVQEAYKADVYQWAKDMGPLFADLPVDTLQKAANAKTFDAMNDALLVKSASSNMQAIAPQLIGDLSSDLVYVPITPCRIFDTRLAGGLIATNTSRGFDVTAVSDYSFQGGAANNCGGAGAAGSFAAAVINFTVVAPPGPGYITAYPFLAARPQAATVNYAAGEVRGNNAIVQLDQGASANEINVYAASATHVVGDITGYFITPQATPLDCTETVSADFVINGGGSGTGSSPVCPAGYAITGGSCSSSSFAGRVVSTITLTSSHFCAWTNEGGGAMDGVAHARCCRTPGR